MTAGPPTTVPAADLADKTVLLVHPAWHSCGSYNVFAAQAEAYRALGAQVHSLAVDGFPGNTAQSSAAKAYVAATQDLKVGERFFTGMPFAAVPTRTFADAANAWLHGDYAAMLVEAARRSALPEALRTMPIDLIHCNHFFCMPVAVRLRGDRDVPVLLDTHDLQARQFALRNRDAWTLAPKATYETMLARELIEMRAADRLIHLNTEEAESFRALLPEKSHVLLFPAVSPMPLSRGNHIVIVASANYPNFLGLKWFLSEVMPQVGDSPVRIIGNIDRLVRWHTPKLYRRYKSLFAGFTGDLAKVYAEAGTILLPTTSGFGISIKTVEALSSGARLIATRPAFRGMGIEPADLNNVALVETAADFASAMRHSAQAPALSEDACANSDTRRLYEKFFTPAVYRERLAALALAALAEPQVPHGVNVTAGAGR
ncbi:MAG: glycosyltransferase [Pseudomonadota bacterium]